MPLIVEDLASHGVVLVPPSEPEYTELYFDVLHRLMTVADGAPQTDPETVAAISERRETGAAVLLNKAPQPIASLAYTWTFPDGTTHSTLPGTNTSVLLPFGLRHDVRKVDDYWKTIFPGSKRLLVADCGMFGDNTDVRPPAEDELWRHHFSFGRARHREATEPLKLTLDGIFFADGAFAGPNQLGTWESTTTAAETYLACGSLAKAAHPKLFDEIARLTGYSHTHPPMPNATADLDTIRQRERHAVGWRVTKMRETLGDEPARTAIATWADAPVPKFHRL
jgi:hypothetical protein